MNWLRTEVADVHGQIVQKLALDANHASWIAKKARSEKIRFYAIKAAKISAALLTCSMFFRIVQAELDSALGVLLVVKTPIRLRIGRCRATLYVPLAHLTAPCQQFIRATVGDLIRKNKVLRSLFRNTRSTEDYDNVNRESTHLGTEQKPKACCGTRS